ncbi:unnamed protein product [Chrysoparadoxa australica]
MASAGMDKVVHFYDIKSKKALSKVIQAPSYLTTLSFHHEGSLLAAGAANGSIYLMDLRNPKEPMAITVAHPGRAVNRLQFQNALRSRDKPKAPMVGASTVLETPSKSAGGVGALSHTPAPLGAGKKAPVPAPAPAPTSAPNLAAAMPELHAKVADHFSPSHHQPSQAALGSSHTSGGLEIAATATSYSVPQAVTRSSTAAGRSSLPLPTPPPSESALGLKGRVEEAPQIEGLATSGLEGGAGLGRVAVPPSIPEPAGKGSGARIMAVPEASLRAHHLPPAGGVREMYNEPGSGGSSRGMGPLSHPVGGGIEGNSVAEPGDMEGEGKFVHRVESFLTDVTRERGGQGGTEGAPGELPASVREELERALGQLRKQVHGDLSSLHLDMLRQFQSLQDDIATGLQEHNGAMRSLLEENQRLREENQKLRQVY